MYGARWSTIAVGYVWLGHTHTASSLYSLMDRRKSGVNLDQGWVGPDASVWMLRTAGEGAGDASVRSDHFARAWTRCVGPLEMPLVTPSSHLLVEPDLAFVASSPENRVRPLWH
jgi:hypothetical protein